jgi:hypothetical protein
MWNKKREDEPQRPTYTPPAPPAQPPAAKPVEANKEMPVSSMQPARFEPDQRSGNSATIGKSVKVIGQIFSREDLFVDGEVEGTLEALEAEAEEKGGIAQLLQDHFQKLYKVSAPCDLFTPTTSAKGA